MIGTNAYYLACKLEKTQVFAEFIGNLEFLTIKKAKPKTDPKPLY